ncbi:hypothetical protein DERP_014611 [Dermatophagoides pteronyssinus]|uniref:MADF domain-containing protein n=1 Tax=Dermatophagoides pteronyssinus TaxID=6956 RepID=A0ABQ8IW24_DERPT|nr:hypothetical protein DERP_014611 [Dermatophagoides pteronyssinus]
MNIDKYSLILAVQKRPILWDFSLQNELKIRRKYDEWFAVTFEVTGQSDDTTVHSIKATWTSLMTIFRRIYKNNINKPYGHNIEVQWKYYSALQFLRKNYDENRLPSSPDDIMFTPQTASTDRQPSSTSTRTKSRKRKSMDADQDDILTQQAQTTTKNHTKRKSEQMLKFIESYEDVWETFSIEELTEIKMKISEGIVEILRIKENKHD